MNRNDTHNCRISRLRVEVAGRSPEHVMGNVKVVLVDHGLTGVTTAVELVGTSNKSECTRESEMPGTCLVFFHTAGTGGSGFEDRGRLTALVRHDMCHFAKIRNRNHFSGPCRL